MEIASHRLLSGVAVSVRPQAAAGSRAEPLWALALAGAVALLLVTDLLAPNDFGGGSLAVLPVLGASWILGRRALEGVVAVAAIIELAGAVHGNLSWMMVAGRLVTVGLVAVVGRVAAVGLAEVRHARQREVDALLQSCQRMGRQLDETGVATEAVRLAASTLVTADRGPVRRAVLVRVTDDRGTVLASQNDAGISASSGRQLDLGGLPTAVRETLASGRPTVVRTAELEPELRKRALLVGAEGWALTRVEVAGRPYGILAAASGGGHGFNRDDMRLLEGIARVTGLAVAAALKADEVLRNAELEATSALDVTTTYSGRLEQAIEAAEEIGSSDELDDVLQRVLEHAVAVAGADLGSISRLENGSLVLEYDHDPTGPGRAPGVRWGDVSVNGLVAEAIRLHRPVTGPVSDGPVEPAKAAWLKRSGLRHVIKCPLVVEPEVVGLLSLGRRRAELFTDADLTALQPFATLAALLLRNARLLADARQAGEAKTTFLNLAAHELRTPLTVIRGYLSLLEDGTYPMPDRTRTEAVEALVQKAQEMELLVETLVMAARLEGATLPRSIEPLDVAQAVREAVERARPRARLEGARIDVTAPDGGVVATADRGHVACILDNLLNNALTYSESPARITVELRQRDPIEVAVCDRGQGIPLDHHDRMFERFYRVGSASPQPGGGLGLGLSISRELAGLNGGALDLERSAPGEGSVFVLRLPPCGAAG